MIKFLPSYVGSKAYWVDRLGILKGENFAELFCGSAVLSANLAHKALLNDIDPYVYNILKHFNQLLVPPVFTQDDYFRCRASPDWWKYIYCLQKMSFSGVFRYSKNGYNVPIKKHIKSVSLQEEYSKALIQYLSLNPTVTNLSYHKVPINLIEDSVVVLDPPYEGAQAAYNREFDYNYYWHFVKQLSQFVKFIVLFDYENNIKSMLPGVHYETRKTRVNGKHQGGKEAMVIMGRRKHMFKDEFRKGKTGEDVFHRDFPDLIRLDGKHGDFETTDGIKIELKTDYFDMEATDNFFIERWSSWEKKTPGGPWQAIKNNCKKYVYFFIINKTWFCFNATELVAAIERIESKLQPIFVSNCGYETMGYKIERQLLKDIFIEGGPFIGGTNDLLQSAPAQ